jgi:parallel beta-helix repeat protein
MYASPNTALVISALTLVGLLACHSDPVSPPSHDEKGPMQLGLGGSTVLVVDDGADCPNADFTTIQAAVDAAEPGSTILVCAGIYYEWVVIAAKDELRLLAKGQPGDVVLDGQNAPAPFPCTPASEVAVRCAGFELRNADGNRIEGFLVRRYWEAGIWLRMGSSGNTIRKNVTTESPHHDGIQLANSPDNVVEQNTSFANFALVPAPGAMNACGINVTGAESVGNTVRHNETFANDFGIQANAATNNVIRNNHSHDNRRVGIRNIASSNGTVIENNRVFDNGGIGQFGGILLSGSTGVTVARNKAFNNVPLDLRDGVGANEFENNHCRTSSPPGLCEHTEGASQK